MGEALLTAFTTALVDTRAYDGCISVETFVDTENPDTIMLIEEWESRGLSGVARRVRNDRNARAGISRTFRDALPRAASRVGASSDGGSPRLTSDAAFESPSPFDEWRRRQSSNCCDKKGASGAQHRRALRGDHDAKDGHCSQCCRRRQLAQFQR